PSMTISAMAQDPSLGAPPLPDFFFPPLPTARPTTTSSPSLRSPPSTSVALPSVRPRVSATDRSSPSGPRAHTRPGTPPRPSTPRALGLPSLVLPSAPGGRKRNATFGILRTLG